MKNSNLQLIPYLHFAGACEEALNSYRQILDGEIEGLNRYDSAPFPAPEHYKNKVLHALFRFGNNSFMACDNFPDMQVESGNNVVLCISLHEEAAARRIFEQLAAGGNITMPLEKQFWGALFGQVTDRFGVRWMVNCE